MFAFTLDPSLDCVDMCGDQRDFLTLVHIIKLEFKMTNLLLDQKSLSACWEALTSVIAAKLSPPSKVFLRFTVPCAVCGAGVCILRLFRYTTSRTDGYQVRSRASGRICWSVAGSADKDVCSCLCVAELCSITLPQLSAKSSQTAFSSVT